jgi:probable HAF family extracellular repeat protein
MILLVVPTIPVRMSAQSRQHQKKNLTYYVVKDLGTLGGTQGVAEGISDRGWVVGDANLKGDRSVHATLWRNGVVTDLGTLGGINSQEQWPVKDNRGLIVGSSETSAMDPFAEDFCGFDYNAGVPPTGLICVGFLWQHGLMSALPTLGGNNAQAMSVNDRGQVVGLAENGTQDPNCVPPQVLDIEAVIWGPKPGQIRQLPPLPGDISAWAIGINEREQIIGVSGDCVSPNFNAPGATTPQHGVIWQDGTVTNLGELGNTGAFPWAINSKGQVVGQSTPKGNAFVHTFLWRNGIMTDLGVLPGDAGSFAFGLNDQGEVVGGSCSTSSCRAFLWKDGVMTDINSLVKPGSTPLYLVFGNDINSRDEIAFYAFDQSNGEFHAAMAIPCDERHNRDQACRDAFQSTSGDSGQPRIILPESVRDQLSKRLVFSRFTPGR